MQNEGLALFIWHRYRHHSGAFVWVPAFAGMTEGPSPNEQHPNRTQGALYSSQQQRHWQSSQVQSPVAQPSPHVQVSPQQQVSVQSPSTGQTAGPPSTGHVSTVTIFWTGQHVPKMPDFSVDALPFPEVTA